MHGIIICLKEFEPNVLSTFCDAGLKTQKFTKNVWACKHFASQKCCSYENPISSWTWHQKSQKINHLLIFKTPLGSVHGKPEKFENAAFISAVGPDVHTNQSRKQSFSKTLFNREEFENADFVFKCEQKTFLR